jgi:hypothetical protein
MSGAAVGDNTARLLAPLASAPPLADGYAYCLYPFSAAAELAAAAAAGGAAGAFGCKVLHLVRHAQGVHNQAVSDTGDEEQYKSEVRRRNGGARASLARARPAAAERRHPRAPLSPAAARARAFFAGLGGLSADGAGPVAGERAGGRAGAAAHGRRRHVVPVAHH